MRVRATVPAEATTARGLGTEREGNGVLIGDEGLVLTIGYLIVEAEAIEVQGPRGSLPVFVPINLLKPILAEMVRAGRSDSPPRPWLGLNTEETEGRVVVTQVTPAGPAERAGLQRGDLILAVEKAPVSGVADFYRRLWAVGTAGVTVRLRVLQGDRVRELSVRSADRHERLLRPTSRPRGGLTAVLPQS